MTGPTAKLCTPLERYNIELYKTVFRFSVALTILILEAYVWDSGKIDHCVE